MPIHPHYRPGGLIWNFRSGTAGKRGEQTLPAGMGICFVNRCSALKVKRSSSSLLGKTGGFKNRLTQLIAGKPGEIFENDLPGQWRQFGGLKQKRQ